MRIGEINDINPTSDIGIELKSMIEDGTYSDATVFWLIDKYEKQQEYISHLEHENQMLYGRLNNVIALAEKPIV